MLTDGELETVLSQLIPEGNKSRASGDGLESTRPATNFPRIQLDTNLVHYLVEKSGLGVEPRPLQSTIKQGE